MMMVLFWSICFFVITLNITLLGLFAIERLRRWPGWSTLWERFPWGKEPQRQPRYPLDLWVWETANDGEVCEDCRERASWPPMDIAEWFKEGFPRTPECETHCGENCRCQIVPYKPRYTNERQPRQR